MDSAVELFTKRGYAGTSLDEVAKRARVTKGALYHHFSGKQALFEAAFDTVESLAAPAREDRQRPRHPVGTALGGLSAYVRGCLDPAFQRIAIHEAPVVMGWERWREAEEQCSFGLVRSGLQSLVDSGEIEPMPVDVTARLLFGALSSAATEIASAADPKKVSGQIEDVIVRMLLRIRQPGDTSEQPAAS